MPQRPPAEAGMVIAEIDTPALLIDLDQFEANLKYLAEFTRSMGIRLRPHAKTHKSPIIARKQIALGAVGQCCQKVGEAEILVEAGIDDILITNEVWGRRKLDRLAGLARHAKIAVCVDHPTNVADLNAAADRAGSKISVLVELDVGSSRCGVATPDAAVHLAREINKSPRLKFSGLQAYHGSAQHKRSLRERQEAIGLAAQKTRAAMIALAEAGLSCDTIGGAGTGTYETEANSGLWNELQAGSYVFLDADYAKNCDADGRPISSFGHSLFVLATAMSQPSQDKLIVDAGHKALSNDSGFPDIWEFPGATYHRPSDEHGMVDLTHSAHKANAGDKLLLVPGHCDPTINLYDWYVCIRGMHTGRARVETLWPVAARGAVL
ncbi:MAG: DSD1 family PLP-dependent enzyme [Hyphomicrobiaceae bacterium]